MSSIEPPYGVERLRELTPLQPAAKADLERILRLVARHFGAENAFVALFAPDAERFNVRTSLSTVDDEAEPLQQFWREVCEADRPLLRQLKLTGSAQTLVATPLLGEKNRGKGVLGFCAPTLAGVTSESLAGDTGEALRDYATLALRILEHQEKHADTDAAQSAEAEAVQARNELGTRLNAIVESVQDLVFIRDAQGRYIFCNQALAELYGLSSDALLGKNIADVVYDGRLEQIKDSDREVIESEVGQSYEISVTIDDLDKTYLINKYPYHSLQGETLGVIGIGRDITERRANEERTRLLASVVKNIEESIVITTPRLDSPGPEIVFVNEAFTEISGYNPEDVLGKTPRILQGPDSNPTVLHRVRERLEEHQPFHGETVNYRKDGSEFIINWYIVPLRDEQGEITHFVAVQRDVTELRRREERLRLLESAVVNANDAILITEAGQLDHPGPRLLYVNPAFTEATGYEATEVIGKSPRFLQGSGTERGQLDKIRAGLEAQRPVQAELLNYTKAGEPYWIDLDITPVSNDEGVTTHFIAVQRDITERKKVQEQLQEYAEQLRASNQTLRSFYDSAPIMMGTVELGDGEIIHLSDNQAAARFFNTIADEMSERSATDLGVPNDYIDLWVQAYEQSYEIGEPLRFEYRHVWPMGSEHWLNVAVNHLGEGPSGRRRFSYVVDDFTERKHASDEAIAAKREAERANAAKSEFLSRMSHELRTPLNAILGFSQLLQMGELAPEERESIEDIEKAGEHLLDLINEVLDIARIESGRMSLSIEPVEVSGLIDESLELITPLAKERGLSVDVKPETERFVMADRQRLKQVLLNLLSNAVKYNREGGRIDVDFYRQDEQLTIEISDTGKGISEAQKRDLFEAFERLGADQDGIQGTGIGLTLTKRLVELMEGNIEVESELDRGSTFRIRFDTAKMPSLDEDDEASIDAEAETPHGANRVLYIEDNLSNLKLIRRIVARLSDIELMSAMQASLGISLAREHRPAVILLDLHLPDMDGAQVLQELKSHDETRDIPVVMISADATPNQIERLKALGAHDYLTKPVDVPRFLDVLATLLNSDGADG